MKKPFSIIEKKNLWFSLSLLIICIAIFVGSSRFLKQENPFNLGIDFTGGSTFLLAFQEIDTHLGPKQKIQSEEARLFLKQLRNTLTASNIKTASLQLTQEGYISIKTSFFNQQDRKAMMKHLTERFGTIILLEADIIGPSIGTELRVQSIWMLLAVSFVLLLYITIRFELYFGFAALLALIHDLLIVLSMAVLFQLEINVAFIAALLTILGYSINDTIVIFDRIRENLQKTGIPHFKNLLNTAIFETMRRSINTSVTTILVCLALFLFGGITIKPFALILLIGFLSGTYSSIFIAAPILFITKPKED